MTHEEFITAFQRLAGQVDRIEALLTAQPALPPPARATTATEVRALERSTPTWLTTLVAKSKCPDCDGPVAIRYRKSDGAPFLGCRDFPKCRGIVPVREPRDKPSLDALAPPDDSGTLPPPNLPF